MTLHLTQFEGGNALSSFRAQQLLTDLVAIHPKITGISARFVHLVATEAAPTAEHAQRLAAFHDEAVERREKLARQVGWADEFLGLLEARSA